MSEGANLVSVCPPATCIATVITDLGRTATLHQHRSPALRQKGAEIPSRMILSVLPFEEIRADSRETRLCWRAPLRIPIRPGKWSRIEVLSPGRVLQRTAVGQARSILSPETEQESPACADWTCAEANEVCLGVGQDTVDMLGYTTVGWTPSCLRPWSGRPARGGSYGGRAL